MDMSEILSMPLLNSSQITAAMAFAVVCMLEASKRRTSANVWYVVYGLCTAVAIAGWAAFRKTGEEDARIVLAGLDVRTGLAAIVWPVAAWAACDWIRRYHRPLQYAAWCVAIMIGYMQIRAGIAEFGEALSAYGVGSLVAWTFIRLSRGRYNRNWVPGGNA